VQTLELDRSVLKEPKNELLLNIAAGCTIGTVNKVLFNKNPKQAIVNQTGFEGISIVGLTTCGASGMSNNPKYSAALCEMVLSIHLLTVDEKGQVQELRIEPNALNADGTNRAITDSKKFKENKQYAHIRLVQDDNVFNACRVNFGALGIVYSMIIRTVPEVCLGEKRYYQHWSKTKMQINGFLKDCREGKIHSFQIWFNVYPVRHEIGTLMHVYSLEPGKSPSGERPAIMADMELEKVSLALVDFVTLHLPGAIPEMADFAIRQPANKGTVIMPMYEAMNMGVFNYGDVDVALMCIPSKFAVEGIEATMKFFQERRKQGYSCLFFASARFCPASTAFLAPQYGTESGTSVPLCG